MSSCASSAVLATLCRAGFHRADCGRCGYPRQHVRALDTRSSRCARRTPPPTSRFAEGRGCYTTASQERTTRRVRPARACRCVARGLAYGRPPGGAAGLGPVSGRGWVQRCAGLPCGCWEAKRRRVNDVDGLHGDRVSDAGNGCGRAGCVGPCRRVGHGGSLDGEGGDGHVSLAGSGSRFDRGCLRRLAGSWTEAGSTRQERHAILPGDDLVVDPQMVTNHGLTIDAPAERVWPWLTQLGWHLGGWYTPRWVDRLLFPDNWASLDRLDPTLLRDLQVGDTIPDGPPGTAEYVVSQTERPRLLVLRSTTHIPPGWAERYDARITWTWTLKLTEGAPRQPGYTFGCVATWTLGGSPPCTWRPSCRRTSSWPPGCCAGSSSGSRRGSRPLSPGDRRLRGR